MLLGDVVFREGLVRIMCYRMAVREAIWRDGMDPLMYFAVCLSLVFATCKPCVSGLTMCWRENSLSSSSMSVALRSTVAFSFTPEFEHPALKKAPRLPHVAPYHPMNTHEKVTDHTIAHRAYINTVQTRKPSARSRKKKRRNPIP